MDHRPGRVLVALVTACAALLGFGAAGSVPPSAAQVTGTGAGSATGSTPGGDHAPPALASTSQAVRGGLLPGCNEYVANWPACQAAGHPLPCNFWLVPGAAGR